MREIVESRDSKRLSFDIAARLENIDQVCLKTEKFLYAQGLRKECFDILLILRELLNNAVIHGSRLNWEKRVHVIVLLAFNTLHIEIEDQGQGFDWPKHLDMASSDSATYSGRGIFIARYFADSCTYNSTGNKVEFTKSFSS